jgi:CMP-N,N'-diacetyllegionaminic acid synthase
MDQLRMLAFIPARAGSKRISGKNIKPLGGKPLIVHSIECALKSPSVSRVIVSTDSPSIRELSLKSGADAPFLRPRELAEDLTPTIDVILHALQYLKTMEKMIYEYLILLEPTSPLRTVDDVETAFQLLRGSGADSVVSLARSPLNSACLTAVENNLIQPLITPCNRLYRLNGAIYISRTETILKTGKLLGEKIVPYFMPDLQSIDIDTPDDFRLAELLVKPD